MVHEGLVARWWSSSLGALVVVVLAVEELVCPAASAACRRHAPLAALHCCVVSLLLCTATHAGLLTNCFHPHAGRTPPLIAGLSPDDPDQPPQRHVLMAYITVRQCAAWVIHAD
jgi:hypothetical protein